VLEREFAPGAGDLLLESEEMNQEIVSRPRSVNA
jgi:hypothetical protein